MMRATERALREALKLSEKSTAPRDKKIAHLLREVLYAETGATPVLESSIPELLEGPAWFAAVEKLMRERYGLARAEYAPMDTDAYAAGDTPEAFVEWYAAKYDLTDIRDTGFGIGR